MTSNLYIVAGPNGAGKTTFAREFLPNYAEWLEFVNADFPRMIAFGKSGELQIIDSDVFSMIADDMETP